MREIHSIKHIKDLCKKLGIELTRSKGQNFLVNGEIVKKIIEAADLGPGETVVEIGPGLGVLTGEIAGRVKRLVAIELDRKLYSYLAEEFGDLDNLELVQGDVLGWLARGMEGRLAGKDYRVIANLPYQITGKILRLLLEMDNPPSEMVVMVQKEVGERITADTGDMSVLAVAARYFAEVEVVLGVGKGNFWPQPKVDSVVLKIKRKKSLALAGEKEKLFFKLVKMGFSSRRKMLKNNLGGVYGHQRVEGVLGELGLNLKARAEDLGVENWVDLAKKISKLK